MVGLNDRPDMTKLFTVDVSSTTATIHPVFANIRVLTNIDTYLRNRNLKEVYIS